MTATAATTTTTKMTKEGLERRKAEAQTTMDISYWKHFVSKQERLLEQVQGKQTTNTTADNNSNNNQYNQRAARYKDCLLERHAVNTQLAQVQSDIQRLDQRQEVVEQGIATSTQQLLEARQTLHDIASVDGMK